MMRPYQIYAVRAIEDCIHQNRGNGYIWHTTGSGKTLTSFKASTLLKDNPDIDKCLFVVDRKDLDRQTREEFNKFQEGCVEENTNTEALVRRLLSDDYANKVIVTTIQKLGLALDGNHKRNYKERLEPLRNQRIVFIFDECHRSQFGENHKAIKEFFPNAQLFGFTGTPIFAENGSYQQIEGQQASIITTEDIFQKQLHAYTITHAIEDRNVLRFHIDYYKAEGKAKPKADETLTQEAIVKAILDKHDTATAGRKFNAILATASINHAIEYHRLFKDIQAQRQAEDSHFKPLNIACVFSPPADGNKDVQQIEEREYYLNLMVTDKLTKRELERQIDASHFERSMISAILSPVARELHPSIGNTFKDNYVLEFLGLPPVHSENRLQKALVQHMKQFILELGKDFIFMGEEYRLQVGNQDFLIDLLFYHRGLSALVAFELKIGKFMPEYLGQINFYLEALDRDVKKPHENPSIGVLLCRDKDDEVVEYALSRNLSPTLIAQYQLQLPDKKLIQAKLHELYDNEDYLDWDTPQKGE
ncbi:MAG: PDDEXK nuclease domain-containing protein [Candidatus Methylumidiphilus sp.]